MTINVVYAEADRDCRELFTFALRQAGHHIHEAFNGPQAIQLIRDEPIDLAILSARLPMMTGYDVARKVLKEAPTLPILFFSGKGMHKEITQAFQSSKMVIDYLVKPASPIQIVAWLETIWHQYTTIGLETIREENMAREWVTAY